jgi:hypothetical protein
MAAQPAPNDPGQPFGRNSNQHAGLLRQHANHSRGKCPARIRLQPDQQHPHRRFCLSPQLLRPPTSADQPRLDSGRMLQASTPPPFTFHAKPPRLGTKPPRRRLGQFARRQVRRPGFGQPDSPIQSRRRHSARQKCPLQVRRPHSGLRFTPLRVRKPHPGEQECLFWVRKPLSGLPECYFRTRKPHFSRQEWHFRPRKPLSGLQK